MAVPFLLLLRMPGSIRRRVSARPLPIGGTGLAKLCGMFLHDVQDAGVFLSLLHQVLVLRPEDAAHRAD